MWLLWFTDTDITWSYKLDTLHRHFGYQKQEKYITKVLMQMTSGIPLTKQLQIWLGIDQERLNLCFGLVMKDAL